jgi:hypothetical protein
MRYSPGQGDTPWEHVEDRHVPEGGHPHGKPSSWVLVSIVMLAFAVGGLALITHAWWLFWTCAGIVLLSIPAGKAIGIMNDTIAWGSTPAAAQPREVDAKSPAQAEADRAREQAGAGRAVAGSGRPARSSRSRYRP